MPVIGKLAFIMSAPTQLEEVDSSFNKEQKATGNIYASGTKDIIGKYQLAIDIDTFTDSSKTGQILVTYYLPEGIICVPGASTGKPFSLAGPYIIQGISGNFLHAIGTANVTPNSKEEFATNVEITFYDTPCYPLV